MNKSKAKFKNRETLNNILIPWGCALVFLIFYYALIELPMERAFIKGVKYLNEKKIPEASREFDKVLSVFPKYEPFYLNITNYHLRNGHYNTANFYFKHSKHLSSIAGEVFQERGLIFSKYRRSFDKGIVFYNNHVMKNYLSQVIDGRQKE